MTSTPSQRRQETDTIGMVHRALAEEDRRRVLYYLYEEAGASKRDLVEHLSERTDADPDSIALKLHHVILPKLTKCGAISHDPSREQIHYQGGSFITEVIELTMDHELTDG